MRCARERKNLTITFVFVRAMLKERDDAICAMSQQEKEFFGGLPKEEALVEATKVLDETVERGRSLRE